MLVFSCAGQAGAAVPLSGAAVPPSAGQQSLSA